MLLIFLAAVCGFGVWWWWTHLEDEPVNERGLPLHNEINWATAVSEKIPTEGGWEWGVRYWSPGHGEGIEYHRLDGPAKAYTIHVYGESDHEKSIDNQQIGGPFPDTPRSTEEWWQRGVPHRLNGPAIRHQTSVGMDEQWIVRGKRHRLDGPAVDTQYVTGFYIDNVLVDPSEIYKDPKQVELYRRICLEKGARIRGEFGEFLNYDHALGGPLRYTKP
jgi:hypothetical protein